MCRKPLFILALAGCLTASRYGYATLIESFDSYADQAAFEATWQPWSANGSSMTFARGIGRNGGGGVHGVAPVNYRNRNARNLDDLSAYRGTDASPVRFEFWLYDADPNAPTPPNGARNFNELRAYVENGIPAYGTGGLQGLIAMGLYNTPVSDDHFHARVYYGGVNAWYSLNTPRTPGWHKLTSLIGETTIRFLVDDQLDTTVPLIDSTRLFAFDGVVLGSGLTSGGYDVTFDDLVVQKTPEPVTILLLAIGGMFLRRLRRA
jgi:hypothetical protein